MIFKSYSFMFIFVFCFVLFLCTALQAELVKNYDSDTDMTTINTKPRQIMDLDPWKQPRLSITIQYPGRNKPSPADLAELEVKMSFISLSKERKFDNYKGIQFYADEKLISHRKIELDTNVMRRSVMETLTLIVPYSEFEIMIEMIEAKLFKMMFCTEGIFRHACNIEIKLDKIERKDILQVPEEI